MKRAGLNLSNGVKSVPRTRSGSPGSRSSIVADMLAGGCHELDDLRATLTDDASLIADFTDFLAADEEGPGNAGFRPDPEFRERLRSRLWRNHVSRSRDLARSH